MRARRIRTKGHDFETSALEVSTEQPMLNHTWPSVDAGELVMMQLWAVGAGSWWRSPVETSNKLDRGAARSVVPLHTIPHGDAISTPFVSVLRRLRDGDGAW